jgi:hypothetical protein
VSAREEAAGAGYREKPGDDLETELWQGPPRPTEVNALAGHNSHAGGMADNDDFEPAGRVDRSAASRGRQLPERLRVKESQVQVLSSRQGCQRPADLELYLTERQRRLGSRVTSFRLWPLSGVTGSHPSSSLAGARAAHKRHTLGNFMIVDTPGTSSSGAPGGDDHVGDEPGGQAGEYPPIQQYSPLAAVCDAEQLNDDVEH